MAEATEDLNNTRMIIPKDHPERLVVSKRKDRISRLTDPSKKDSLKETRMQTPETPEVKTQKVQEKVIRERNVPMIEIWIAN